MEKRTVLTVVAFLALLGIANCALIEPALASHDNVAKCADEATPCCSRCNPFHHQWAGPQDVFDVNNQGVFVLYSPAPAIATIDPPVGAIFHPPTYL
jgi:hypothetical protein